MMEFTTQILRLIVAVLYSGLIGYEREQQHKPAGLRTCMFVTLAATMIMIFSEIMVGRGLSMDAVRAGSYMLTGIGFLGAGIIMSKGSKVEGITTAAMLLVLVPLGLLIGIGELVLAGACTLLIYFVLKLKYVQIKMKTKRIRKLKKK